MSALRESSSSGWIKILLRVRQSAISFFRVVLHVLFIIRVQLYATLGFKGVDNINCLILFGFESVQVLHRWADTISMHLLMGLENGSKWRYFAQYCAICFFPRPSGLTPPLEKIVFNSHVVEHFPNGLVDDIVNCFGLVVKCGHGRKNMGSVL